LTHFIKLSKTAPINRNYTTKDYVKLKNPLHLAEYGFKFRAYSGLAEINPFGKWDSSNPSLSLSWYDAYNKTKHSRTDYFNLATLGNCINAVLANFALYIVRFGVVGFDEASPLASLINHHFSIRLIEPNVNSFYIPELNDLDASISYPDLRHFNVYGYCKPWRALDLVI
jgi:hypothetical protein